MIAVGEREQRRGLWVALSSFVVWGVMPLYWYLLRDIPSIQAVLHRAVWCALLVGTWLTWRNGRGWLWTVLRQPRLALMLAASGTLIAFNWGLYVWSVTHGHVVEASLGYFINPLLNVLIGVLFLRERLTPIQWVTVALAAIGVLWLTFNYGTFPWIALSLAVSFAFYGLIRRYAAVDPVTGLGVETMIVLLPAVIVLGWFETRAAGGFFDLSWGLWSNALLVLSGGLTAVPLIGFAYAVRRVPLTLIGVMQYLSPTLQLLLGVFFFGEAFGLDRAIGFGFIWAGLALFALDGGIRLRRRIGG